MAGAGTDLSWHARAARPGGGGGGHERAGGQLPDPTSAASARGHGVGGRGEAAAVPGPRWKNVGRVGRFAAENDVFR